MSKLPNQWGPVSGATSGIGGAAAAAFAAHGAQPRGVLTYRSAFGWAFLSKCTFTCNEEVYHGYMGLNRLNVPGAALAAGPGTPHAE